MPVPVALIAGALGQAVIQVATKPWPWIAVVGLFAVGKFDLGVFADEVQRTIWSLWPFVILMILAWIAIAFIRIYVTQNKHKDRPSK